MLQGIAKSRPEQEDGSVFVCCYHGERTGLPIKTLHMSLCRRAQQRQANTVLFTLTTPFFLVSSFLLRFPFFCVCGICAVAVVKEGHYNPALHLNHEQIYTCCAQLSTSTCKTSCCNVLLLKDICILHPLLVSCVCVLFYAR